MFSNIGSFEQSDGSKRPSGNYQLNCFMTERTALSVAIDMFSQLQYLKTLFIKAMPYLHQIDIMIKVYLKVRCSFCHVLSTFICL